MPMMINKRLIGAVPESRKYVAGNVAVQWVSLAANICMMDSIAQLLQKLFESSADTAAILATVAVGLIALAVRFACAQMTEILLPETLETIGYNAFQNTGLYSVEIPSGVTTLSGYMFADCANLEYAVLPETITGMGHGVFQNCENLSMVNIPDSVVSFGSLIFDNCPYFAALCTASCDGADYVSENGYTFMSPNNMEYLLFKDEDEYGEFLYAVAYFGEGGDITVPASVDGVEMGVIYDGCFYDNTTLSSVIISEPVFYVGAQAFAGCTEMAKILIPTSVEYIADDAFESCDFTAYVYKNSYAHEWCTDMGITCKVG